MHNEKTIRIREIENGYVVQKERMTDKGVECEEVYYKELPFAEKMMSSNSMKDMDEKKMDGQEVRAMKMSKGMKSKK